MAAWIIGAESFRLGLLATAVVFGFRHGIDWDHIAALNDITATEPRRRRAMVLSSMYAAGHATVVFVLGVAAIVLAERLPSGVDTVMERIVGVTLVALGAYVVVGLLRHGDQFRMRSRWMLVIGAVRSGLRRLRAKPAPVVIDHEHDHAHGLDHGHDHGHIHRHDDAGRTPVPSAPADRATTPEPGVTMMTTRHAHRHRHRHVLPVPDDPFVQYGRVTCFGVGMLHGVGAETPTQVLMFATAAGAGNGAAGVAVLIAFLAGLVAANTTVAVIASFGALRAASHRRAYLAVSAVTAGFSLVIGAMFLLGLGSALPSLLGG